MKIRETGIAGVRILESTVHQDMRGSFARLFSPIEFRDVLRDRAVQQINLSRTYAVGAIRGLHYQRFPYAELKIVRCIKGRVFDVAVDLRRESPSFLRWAACELTPESNLSFIVPEGCAHGFQVLEADSQLLYLHTQAYMPEAEGAVRFDEPQVAVDWPLGATDLSIRDLCHPYLGNEFEGICV